MYILKIRWKILCTNRKFPKKILEYFTGVSELERLTGGMDVAAAAAATVAIVCILVLAVRQCLSYRIPNKTIKYSIKAKNTNNVHDMSHTCKKNNIVQTEMSYGH